MILHTHTHNERASAVMFDSFEYGFMHAWFMGATDWHSNPTGAIA